MANTYLIGDPHFFHANIIKYVDRPFKDIEEMTETLVENWNSVVQRQDQVFILGDFCFPNHGNMEEVVTRLHGRKVLIMGNHDTLSHKTYIEAGMDIVSKWSILFDGKYILSHKPVEGMENDKRFCNIYAHVHTDIEYPDFTKNTFCVSAERINYTPININEAIRAMKYCK